MLDKVDEMIEKELLGEEINIEVGSGDGEAGLGDMQDGNPEHDPVSLNLNIRQTLDGKYVIRDHIDMEIVVDPEESKIILLPKEEQFDSEILYSSQSDMFDFLKKKGVIKHDSIEGGNSFCAMQAEYPEIAEGGVDSLQAVIFTIGKFIEKERPYMEFDENYFDKMLDRLVDPEDEETTDLGEVPHDDQGGTIDQTTYPASLTYSSWY